MIIRLKRFFFQFELTFIISVLDSSVSEIRSNSIVFIELSSRVSGSLIEYSFLEQSSSNAGDLVLSIGAEYSFLVQSCNGDDGLTLLSIGAEYSFFTIIPALAASEYEDITGLDQLLISGRITVDLGVTDIDLPFIFLTMLQGV